MALTKNQSTALKVGGAIVAAAGIYYGFIKKDALGLTQWAKLTGKTNPAVKPQEVVKPNSDRTPDNVALNATGKKPRSKETYTDSKGNVWLKTNRV